MGQMLLSGRQPELLAWLIEYAFRSADHRDSAGAELRQLATQAALTEPAAAVRMTALMRAIGPEAAAAVRAQAARMRGSEQDVGRLPLTSSEAAGLSRVTDRAVRQACIDGRLAGRKDKNTGRWLISRGALAEWEARRAT